MSNTTRQRFLGSVLLSISICLFLASCASVRFMEDLSDYTDRVAALEEQITQNPNDATALRDLGIIYLRTNNFAEANEHLQLAFARDNDDPKTVFYLGLANETLGRYDVALRLYETYPDYPLLSQYRRLMAGRYEAVVRKTLEDEVQARLAEEQRIQEGAPCSRPVEPSVLAVYPLTYRGTDDQFAPLGRGLAEMITVDLAQVRQLQLVERARLQDLVDEINLSNSSHFDPSQAPRVGCLSGAGRLVGGSYDVLGGNDLRVDGSIWESEQAQIQQVAGISSALRNFFELEKQFVFSVLQSLAIELTPEERQRIERIPTQNLQAFLAYCRGLLNEDEGNYEAASGFYQQAQQLDPNFQDANDRAEKMEGLAIVSGSPLEAMIGALSVDPAESFLTPTVDPLSIYLNTLSNNLGAHIVPSQDNREGAAELGTAGITGGTLPDPPDPPSNGGGN